MTTAIRLYRTYIQSTFVPLNTIRRVFRVFRDKTEIEYQRQTFVDFFDEHGLEPTKMHEKLFLGASEPSFLTKLQG